MSPDDAALFGLSEVDRRSLIRLDSGKVNIAPPATEAAWFRLIGVKLENGTTDYPNGDEVQIVVVWEPPDRMAGLSSLVLNAILDDIDKGLENGQRYFSASAATTRAACGLSSSAPQMPPKSSAGPEDAAVLTAAKSGARHPRHARAPGALRVAAGGSAPPIPFVAPRGLDAARWGRESKCADRTGKPDL